MSIENPEVSRLLVKAKATYYRDFVRVWIPDQPYIHWPKGIEQRRRKIATRIDSDEDAELYETNVERSLRRTKKTIKDYVHMNDFEWFVTFTFGTDRYNDNRNRTRLANWLRNQRKRNGKFRYLLVLERHDDGALHAHALMGGYNGKLLYAKSSRSGRRIPDGHGDFIRNLGEYRLGFNTVEKVQDTAVAARYLMKYITKENLIEFGKNRFWASKNLNKPVVEENPEPFYRVVDWDRHLVLDHGTILEFDRGKSPFIDIFIDEANGSAAE